MAVVISVIALVVAVVALTVTLIYNKKKRPRSQNKNDDGKDEE